MFIRCVVIFFLVLVLASWGENNVSSVTTVFEDDAESTSRHVEENLGVAPVAASNEQSIESKETSDSTVEGITDSEDTIRELEFTLANFVKLDNENRLLKDEIAGLKDEIALLYAVINEEQDTNVIDRTEEIEALEEQLEAERSEYDHQSHMTRVSLCDIEDTFRRIVHHLSYDNYEEVEGLLTNNLQVSDGHIQNSNNDGVFELPDSEFYFTIDLYSIDLELNKGGVIYEFFDIENNRIYFCVASFVKKEYTWYLDEIESTLEP